MDIDDVYVKTGEFGWFQKKAFFGFCLVSMFCGTQMLQNVFTGFVPDPSNATCDGFPKLRGCDENCHTRNYHDGFQSFAMEWDMVCTGKAKADTTQSIYMLGVMVGSFFMGGLGDRFGRFPCMFMAHLLTSLFALISSFANVWELLAALRFFTGFFLSGILIIGFVLTCELVGPSKRGLVGTIPALAFAVGVCVLSMMAKISSTWRILSVATSVVGLVLVPVIFFLFEESPRWHLGNGRVEKSKQILLKIAAVNGHNLGSIDLKVSKKDPEQKATISSILSHKILLKLTLIQLLSWFTISSVYYGLTIASGNMGGNRYVSVILNAFVEIPSNILVVSIVNIPRFGRVKTCVASMVISSVCCASIFFIDDSHATSIIGLACSGKFFICMAFAIIYIQGAELYPTPVRNVGIGLISVANRIGGVLAPQVLTLDSLYHNSHYVVFGVVGCISAFFCFMLPETVGKPLPETAEDIYSKSKKLDKEVIPMRDDRKKLLDDFHA